MAIKSIPIEHTADTGVRVFGETPEKLFEHGAEGMLGIIFGEDYEKMPKEKKNIKRFSIDSEGIDPEDRLFDFLSQILYLLEGEKLIVVDFEESRSEESKFSTRALVIDYDPEIHKKEVEIKAVTFHRMKIEEKDGLWQTDLIFDV